MMRSEPNQDVGGKADAHAEPIDLGASGLRLLNGIAMVVTAICVIVLLLNHDAGLSWQTGATLPGSMVGALVLLLIHLRRARLALLMLLWAFILLPVIGDMSSYGIAAPGLYLVPVSAMAACLLLSPRQGLIMTTSATVLCALFYWLTVTGRIATIAPLPSVSLLALLSTVLAAALIGLIGANALRAEFARVKSLAHSLAGKAEQLQRSEAGFSALFRSNPLPSLTGNASGRILDVNDVWLTTFGFAREQVVGKTIAELGIFPEADIDSAQLLARAEVDGHPVRLHPRDGSTRIFLLSTSQFELDDGWHYIALLLDQTDRLAAEQAQQQLNLELESRVSARTAELSHALEDLQRMQNELVQSEKLAALGSMVAGIAHELNTPVGNVLMVASSLAEHQQDFERSLESGVTRTALGNFLASVQEVTSLMDRNLQRIANIVSTFKQVAVDQNIEHRRFFDLKELLTETTLTIGPVLRISSYTLQNEVPAGLQLDSYPGPLAQVLQNLISNALKHAFDGRDQGIMTLSAERLPDDWVRMRFADNGVGIPAQNLARIFDPFFTTKMGQGGSGLGLCIVHNIVTGTLGGRISVRSKVGEGTEFRIDMPMTPHPGAPALLAG